jgi:hypothetical protein
MLKPGALYVRKLVVFGKSIVAFTIVSINADRWCSTIDVCADGSIIIDPGWQLGRDDPSSTLWEYLGGSDE